jgi:Flp pilus assembly protein TadD
MAWIEKALEREPGLYAARRGQIELLRKAGRFHEAEKITRRILQQLPNDASLHAELGVLLGLSGNSAEAVREFDRALQLDPKLDAARVHRAVARMRMGKRDEARAELEAFLKEKPHSPEAARARAVLEELAK